MAEIEAIKEEERAEAARKAAEEAAAQAAAAQATAAQNAIKQQTTTRGAHLEWIKKALITEHVQYMDQCTNSH